MGLLPPKNEEPSVFHFLGTKNGEPPSIFHSLGRKNKRRTPSGTSSSDLPLPGHQLPSSILKSGSSNESLTLKIGLRNSFMTIISKRGRFEIVFVVNTKVPGYALHAPVESKTRTYHGRFGSAQRTAGRRGGAGPSRTGCRRVGWPRSQRSL